MTPALVQTVRGGAVALLVMGALAVPGTASAAGAASTAQVNGGCDVSGGAFDTSATGAPAWHNYPRAAYTDLSAHADPGTQVARVYNTAEWETPDTPRSPYGETCRARADFTNRLVVGAGSTGLGLGAPVTLLARVRLAATVDELADLNNVMTTQARLSGGYAVYDPSTGAAPLVNAYAYANRTVSTSAGWYGDPDGYAGIDGEWSWQLSSNTAERQADEGSLDKMLCEAIPCFLAGPDGALPSELDPFPHPMGTRTVAFTTRVGAELTVTGSLMTFTQAFDRTVSGTVDASDGLSATVLPATGFEGLDLQLGSAPVQDTEAPTLTVTPDRMPNENGWYRDDVTLDAVAADGSGSGVASVTYQTVGGAAVTVAGSTATVPVTGSGSTTVQVWATDVAGNSSQVVTTEVRLDRAAPVLTVPAEQQVTGSAPTAVSYDVTVTDGLDAAVTANCTPASGSTFPVGRTTVGCTATDAAGNTAAASFDVVVQAPPDATSALAAFRATLLALELPTGPAYRIGTALRQLEANATGPEACARLAKLVAAVTSSRLEPGAEEALLDAAQEVRTALGC